MQKHSELITDAIRQLEVANTILFHSGEVEARKFINDAKLNLGIAKRILDEDKSNKSKS